MKLIAQVRLYPTEEQASRLLLTLEAANAVCNRISDHAWEAKSFKQYDLHKAIYHAVRGETNLTAQVVVRCIAKVADAYKLDKKTKRTFRQHGSIAYDDRILKWFTAKREVSIWADGRMTIPYKAGERQQELLQYRQGESDLVYRHGKFYLLATCDIPDPDERDVDTALGVDLGVVNIAVTSDGDTHSSDTIERNRQRMQRLRRDLQKRGTKSAKRHLKKLAGKQARFQKDTNHVISKRIVERAERTNTGISVENLTGIRSRTRVKGTDNRAKHSNWAFRQLRAFIAYKAKQRGVRMWEIDPRYTSQRCFCCGHIERANRKSQGQFLCVSCGHADHADVNAAKNIAWAAVNPPIVTSELGANPTSVASPGL
jgi:IS605 OrfB family transposase